MFNNIFSRFLLLAEEGGAALGDGVGHGAVAQILLAADDGVAWVMDEGAAGGVELPGVDLVA